MCCLPGFVCAVVEISLDDFAVSSFCLEEHVEFLGGYVGFRMDQSKMIYSTQIIVFNIILITLINVIIAAKRPQSAIQ